MKNKLLISFKKITSYVIALSMIALSFPFAPAQATGATLTIGSQFAQSGAHIVVPITGSAFTVGTDIFALQFRVNYDNTLLSYTGHTNATIGNTTINDTGSYISIVWDHNAPLVLDNETFVSLNFDVISSSTVSTDLTHSNKVASNSSGNAVTISIVDGVVSLNSIQATPTFSPVSGAVAWGTAVTIISEGADSIYYTTNGDDPTISSTNQATTPLVISSAVTVKALAVKAGYTDSAIGSASYTQAAATVPSSIVLEVGSTAAVGGVTNVVIPAAGGTDTTGAVIGWITGTNDKIKLTVTDNGGASTITINAVGYTSGADYVIAAASPLSIVVTTTEEGKTTGIRTFTVSVAAAADATALNNVITAANSLHDSAIEGTAVGQYAVGSKATFNTAIDAAEVIYAARLTKTQEEIDTAVSDLATADGIFDAAIVVAGDATALNDAITAANALHDGAMEGTTVGTYVVGSKTTFNMAIDAAEVIYAARATKTQGQLDTAVSDLATADGIFDAALITAGDATALNDAITAANLLHDGATEGTDYGQYSSGSKATFNTAIDAAEVIYAARETKTQAQLDTAVSDLATADGIFDAAIVVAGDATALNDAITAANLLHDGATEGTDYGQYSSGSKATFNTAIDAAEVIYAARATKSSTQLAVAVETLATADSIFDSAIVVAGDPTALNNAIEAANLLHDGATEGTTVGTYVVGSKATFNTAIDAAEVIYAARLTKSATQLTAAVTALETADGIFDAALITETSLVAEYTNATDAATFVTLLDANNLELTLTDYVGLDATGKTAVGTEMLGINTFADKAAVQSAVTTAIANAKPDSDVRIADIATVASAKSAITGGTYTNLEVVDLAQATKTAAVQVVVDSLKGTTTAVVTFVTPNYSVAISKGVASDTYIITTATFTLISKTALINAIEAAITNKDSVATSADGTDVKSSNQWVTSGVKTTYTDAIAAAQTVVNNESASQGQIDSAVTTLAGATSTFNAAKANGSDDIAPTVTKIGDDSADVTIASNTDATLTFSETLSIAGKTAVQNALTNGADKVITYSWDVDSTILTITGHATDLTTFANDVMANVTDVAGNSSVLLLIDSSLTETQTTPDGSGDATVSTTTPQVVITNPTQTVTITVDGGTDNPTIDVSSFIGSNGTGTLPAINITSANANNTTVAIPTSTTITSADTSWDGVIAAPTVTTVVMPVTSGVTKTFSTAIQVGFAGTKLSFDNAVKIILPGQANKRAGYIRDGISFTEITTTCGENSQNWANVNLGTDGDCKINSGSDLIIWTKHFTSFATYTQTTNNTGSGGGGGGAPVISCTSVVYSDWGSCINGFQFRSVLSQTPAGCSLTTQQQIDATRDCIIDDELTEDEDEENILDDEKEEKELGDSTAFKKGDELKQEVLKRENSLQALTDNFQLTNRLSGRILLQVEEKGEAWYVEPVSQQRHYMGRPADAFSMMRTFGLGISEENFKKFEEDGVPSRFSGRILLRVEANGEAYYVNPVDMKMHFLNRPDDAFRIMRELALGINNENLRQIPLGLDELMAVCLIEDDLSLGMDSPEVMALQKYLNTTDFPVALSGTGSKGNETSLFGSLTEIALKKYQAHYNLNKTGVFDEETRNHLVCFN